MLRLLTASFLLLLIDLPWLLFQGASYQKVVSSIQGSPLRLRAWAAIPVYLALGYLLLQQKSALSAAASGACVYAVYDFTTLAIFDKYPLYIALLDTLWGGVLFALAFKALSYIS
jgi:uncharacterized membrane protein